MQEDNININFNDHISTDNIKDVVNYIQLLFDEKEKITYKEINGDFVILINGKEVFNLNATYTIGQVLHIFEEIKKNNDDNNNKKEDNNVNRRKTNSNNQNNNGNNNFSFQITTVNNELKEHWQFI